jgi:hypothetical protein
MADEEDFETLLRRHRAHPMKPSERWPNEPPAPDLGPDSGVREPRRPRPEDDPDAAMLSLDDVDSDD